MHRSKDGKRRILIGLVPLDQYRGRKDIVNRDSRFVKGETTGIYIIEEISPNVCMWTRIQNFDVKASLPAKALNFIAKIQLGWADDVREKYRRNGKIVDKEVRNVLVVKMREGVELTEDQEKVFEDLDDLFVEGKRWEDLQSPYTSVDMWIKIRQQAKGKRSIALGKAEAEADCTAEEACAWYFEYSSNERWTLDREDGNPARLEIRKGGYRVNEKHYATVKKMPFPLSNREFVGKQIWRNNQGEEEGAGKRKAKAASRRSCIIFISTIS